MAGSLINFNILHALTLSACLIVSNILFADDKVTSSFSRPSTFFAFPFELDADSGASNGDATIFRMMPLYSFPLSTQWKLVNLNLVTIADTPGGIPGQPGNPDPVTGGRVLGMGDLIHASFATPIKSGNLIWGLGAMISVPTATDQRLGSGKWSGGPSARIAYQSGQWNLGAFGGQLWSFAGDDQRKDISQLMVRALIRRQLPNKWFFVSSPIITANWNAASDQRWLVPLGGGIGKRFSIGKYPWAASMQGYYNVIKPDGAPNWSVRLAMIAAIPLGK